MKTLLILFLSLAMLSGQLFAQVTKEKFDAGRSNPNIMEDLYSISEGGVYTRTFDNRYEGVKGSPYVNDEWTKGGIYLLSGKYYHNINLKLDAYNDALIYKDDHDQQMMLDKDKIDYFILTGENGNLRKFKLVRSPQDVKGSYYEVLYDRKSSLLILHSKLFVKADYQKAINTNRLYDEFKDDSSYYVIKQGSDYPQKIKLNKRTALDLFGEKEGFKKFLSENNLKMKKEQDWIDAMKFYDSVE